MEKINYINQEEGTAKQNVFNQIVVENPFIDTKVKRIIITSKDEVKKTNKAETRLLDKLIGVNRDYPSSRDTKRAV